MQKKYLGKFNFHISTIFRVVVFNELNYEYDIAFSIRYFFFFKADFFDAYEEGKKKP